jgi:hypothetical protein
MLVDIFRNAKKAKEAILVHLTMADTSVEARDTLVLGESQSTVSAEPKAVIQSLNFLTLAPEPTMEDLEFRENLATHFFDHDKGSVKRVTVPYVALEKEMNRRHGSIKNSYPTLEGKPLELAEYIYKQSSEFQKLGATHGENEKEVPAPKVYPFSAVNIHLPWQETAGEYKGTINLPSEAETAEIAAKLTKEQNSQVTLFISGPAASVAKYQSNLAKELTKIRRKCLDVADIQVSHGFLTSASKPSRFALDCLECSEALSKAQKALKAIEEGLLKEAANYVDQRIAKKLEERRWRRRKDEDDVESAREAREAHEETMNQIGTITQDFEQKLTTLRRSSTLQHWMKWKSYSWGAETTFGWESRKAKEEGWAKSNNDVRLREEALDKNLTALGSYVGRLEAEAIKAAEKPKAKAKKEPQSGEELPMEGSPEGSAEASVAEETPGGEEKTPSEAGEGLPFSSDPEEAKKALLEELKEVISLWGSQHRDLLSETRQQCKSLKYIPWALRAIHIVPDRGVQNWAHPVNIRADEWDEEETKSLQEKLAKNKVTETHLATPRFTGEYKNGHPIHKLVYPRAKEKRLLNPKNFGALPAELEGTSSMEALTGKMPEHSIKLDIRLSPRPELATELLLENDNLQIDLYNPVAGRPTGFKEATLWRPILTRKGISHVENALSVFGYKLSAEASVFNFAERKVRQAEKCLSPNYALTPYEAMAYFDNGPRAAEATVLHPETGEPLWLEGKIYHITPSWRRQTMMVDHSIEEETSGGQEEMSNGPATPREGGTLGAAENEAEALVIPENIEGALEAEDIVTVGQSDTARRIANSQRIQTLTERRINYGFATFIVEAEGERTYEIRETVSKDTITMEKERIAVEIEHLMGRLGELEEKDKRTKVENSELRKLEEQIADKTKELDTWAPMIEDFLTAFPPPAPALTTEIYEDKIRQVMKRIYARFGPCFKNSPDDKESSIKDYQLKWAAIGAVKRGHANASSPGAGKAQPLTSKVLTARGWINMGDITLEDQVLTPDGSKAEVLGIYPQGEIPIYEVELKDGRKVRACKDHLWKIHNKAWLAQDKAQDFPIPENHVGCKIISTEKLIELKKTDARLYIPQLEAVAFEKADLPMEPYLLGALLGDGGITHHINFTNADSDVIEECRKALHPDYRIKRVESTKYGYGLSHKDGVWKQPKGSKRKPKNPYWEALKNMGLAGHSSPEKFIPEVYKKADHSQRVRLIQGLMDTDGSVDQNGSLHFYSTSKQLASDFLEIIWSLGGTGFVSPKQTYYTHLEKRKIGRPSYVVNFRHNNPKQFVRCKRKNIRISEDYQYAGSVRNEIVGIKLVGKEEAQCILIDHPEHLYITDNYVVTHNTLMSIAASWEMGHHYNWVICPTIAMKTWAKELERVGLYHEIVGYRRDEKGGWVSRGGVYEHMRELTARFHARERMRNHRGEIEPEYYIISAESVSLGGEGNKTYSAWHYDHRISGAKLTKLQGLLASGKLTLPAHWSMHRKEESFVIRVWSDRSDNAKEIQKHGFKEFLRPVKFSRAVKECPMCGAGDPVWTTHGFCNACKHSHRAVTRQKSGWDMKKKSPLLRSQWASLSAKPPSRSRWEGEKSSNRQYPLYKLMRKHVGCKIIDEVHNWSNFHSQHGAALLQVKAKDTIILSGTLCKTHINELEPSLCQIYEANSGEFPYSPWGMDLFKEQFQTLEIESSVRTRTDTVTDFRQVRRNNREKVVPEASNLTKLRALLHGIMCSVGENEMERVWNLRPIRESIRYVELQEDNAAIYEEWERLMKESYSECKTEAEKVGMIRKARTQLTNLSYACDGPEKLAAAIEWIKAGMARGQRSVIVGPSTRFYTMLCQALKEQNVPFMSMGGMDPEKRFDFLNKFRDSECPNFVSRIRLVNVNFNQLTCCQRILFTGIDPSPAAIRQMQKRLNRIGQENEVECTFLITQLPPRNRQNGARLDALEAIGVGEGGEDPEAIRPMSFEERLFALVLRRENAIKQTLQQADRQRDPQELYEMLKDRQTLNQLLQDIVEDTRSDTDVSDLIRSMAQTVVAEEENPTREETTAEAAEAPVSVQEAKEEAPKGVETGAILNGSAKRRSKSKKSTLELPEGFEFVWKPVKKVPGSLQGELFSL